MSSIRHPDLVGLLETNAPAGEWLRSIRRKRCLGTGEILYREGDAWAGVYCVHAGALKLVRADADGHEHISRFLLRAEVAGLEGLEQGRHFETATALDPTEVWEIPYEGLQQAMGASGVVRHAVCRAASRGQRLLMRALWRLGTLGAEGRLADFLLAYSERPLGDPADAQSFVLAMPRFDLANYLGMNTETASRLLSLFAKQRMIAVKGREIRILDRDRLFSVVSGGGRHRQVARAAPAVTPQSRLSAASADSIKEKRHERI